MLSKNNFRISICLALSIFISSCAQHSSINRELAEAGAIPKIIFAEAKVASTLFDDALKLQLDDLLRSEANVTKLKNLGQGKTAEFTLTGGKSGSSISFLSKTNHNYQMVLTVNGKKTVLAEVMRFNFNLTQEQIAVAENKYVFESNGMVEITYTKPGTKGSAELYRESEVSYAANKKEWKKNEFVTSAYFKSIQKVLEEGGLTEAEKKILKNLAFLGFQALTLSCGSLSEESKVTMANLLERLVTSSIEPQKYVELLKSYMWAVKLSDPEVGKQLLEIIRRMECGLNVKAFV